MPWSGVNRMLGLFICNDADVEECQGICFTKLSLAKFPSSSFLLKLNLNCASEILVEEINWLSTKRIFI